MFHFTSNDLLSCASLYRHVNKGKKGINGNVPSSADLILEGSLSSIASHLKYCGKMDDVALEKFLHRYLYKGFQQDKSRKISVEEMFGLTPSSLIKRVESFRFAHEGESFELYELNSVFRDVYFIFPEDLSINRSPRTNEFLVLELTNSGGEKWFGWLDIVNVQKCENYVTSVFSAHCDFAELLYHNEDVSSFWVNWFSENLSNVLLFINGIKDKYGRFPTFILNKKSVMSICHSMAISSHFSKQEEEVLRVKSAKSMICFPLIVGQLALKETFNIWDYITWLSIYFDKKPRYLRDRWVHYASGLGYEVIDHLFAPYEAFSDSGVLLKVPFSFKDGALEMGVL